MTATVRDLLRRHATLAATTGALLLVLLASKLMPSSTSSSISGAPWAVVFQGVVDGLLTALSAAGVVLVYRTTRVINFAQIAIGAGGGVLAFDMLQLTPVPFWVDVPLGLAMAGALGVAFELVFGRRFARAPRLVLTVLTIISAGLLSGVGQTVIDTLPFFPARDLRTIPQLQGSASLRPLMPFSGFSFRFPDLDVHFGFAEIFAIVCALLALAGIGAFLRYTKAGVAVRAMAESTERAALLGISVGMLSMIVWGLAGVLSGLSVTLQGLVTTPSVTFGFAPSLLLPAFAAAVVARMNSIPVAAAAAVGISVLDASVRFLQPDLTPVISLGLLVLVAAGLLLQGRRQGRADRGATSSWVATEEPRPVPREMLGLAPVRLARWGIAVVGLAAVCIYPFITSSEQTFLGSVIALYAIVGLSLVILTGWAGQVSLGQFAFAAIGAVLAGALAQKAGFSFWLAVPVASVMTAGVAVAIGLPALRIPGLFLAVATFAFAVVVRNLLFSERFFGWLLPHGTLSRPTLFGLDFADTRAMYFLCVAALIVAILVVSSLRRSRLGRVIIAVRENEANAQAAGISVVRTKLTAFAVAGMLAGFAGAIFAFQDQAVSAQSFDPSASIDVFVLAVIGGVSSVGGPLLGSLYQNGVGFAVAGIPELAQAIGPLAALILLYIYPGGLLSIVVRIRDAALRIVAQRNQLVVPSLFADVDPEALHLRLIPLTAPQPGSGLQAIRRRYRLTTSALAAPRSRSA